MAVLHLLRSSGFSDNNFAQCISTLADDDGLVLLDDGCYNIHQPIFIDLLNKENHQLYCLAKHCQARGLKTDNNKLNLIDSKALIQLFFNYDTVLTWQ